MIKKSLAAILLFHILIPYISWSQTLSVSTNVLSFGDTFENAPDSLSLTLTNNIGRDVTVTGIKFYNTYGSPAFSVNSSWFIIPNGGSANIWVRFSPQHNILHNSEMIIENDGLRGCVNVNLIGQGKYSDHYYDLSENQSEQNLKNVLKLITGNGFVSLGYNVARDSMFMNIDNKKINGQGATQNTLECIYTGREAVGYTDRSDAQTGDSFNTEHTFPQSLFTSLEPMRSDLHHLFPTDDNANNQRDNNPFAVVSNPSWSNGGSLSNGIMFEPRDVQKGATSRAMFYFVIRYQNYSNYLNSQESILRQWHHTFLPTAIDKKRNSDINLIQHNKNPFVDYPVLLDRITSVSTNSIAPLVNSIDVTEDTIIFGTIQPSIAVTYNFVVVNNGNTDIHFTNFNLTHPAELSFAFSGNDTILAPGESLPVPIRCLLNNTDSIRAFLTFNTDALGNSFVSVPVFVNDEVFTNINEMHSDLVVSPNPAHDFLKISTNYKGEFHAVDFYDITGKIMQSSKIVDEKNIPITDLSPGIYLLRISGSKGVSHKKIVIQ